MALHVQDEVSLVSEHFTADFTVILLVHVAVVLLHVNSQVSIQLKKKQMDSVTIQTQFE